MKNKQKAEVYPTLCSEWWSWYSLEVLSPATEDT